MKNKNEESQQNKNTTGESPTIKQTRETGSADKTIIHCPNCKSTFDISKYIKALELRFFNKIKELKEELKNDNNNTY